MSDPTKSDGLLGLGKDTVLYGVADFIPRAINFLLLPLMTRFLTTEDYGILALFQVIVSAADVLFIFGTHGSYARFHPEASTPKERGVLVRSLSFQIALHGIVGAAFLLVLLPVGMPLAFGQGSISFWPFGIAAVVLSLCYLPTHIPLLQWRMEGRPLSYLAFRLGTFLVSSSAIIYFVVFAKQGAWGSVKGQAITACVAGVVVLWAYRKTLFGGGIEKSWLVRSWKYGTPLFLNQASGWVFTLSDRLFIQRFRTIDVVGLYQMGFMFTLPVSFLIDTLNFAWMPRFLREVIESKNYEKMTRDSLRIFCAVLFGLLVFLAFIKPGIYLMTEDSFHISYRIAEILTFYFVARIHYCLISQGLAAQDRTGSIAKITVATGIVQLTLNFILIPKWGALGAAAGTVVAGAFRSVIAMSTLQKVWPIQFPVSQGARLVIPFLIAGGIILGLDFSSPNAWSPATIGIKAMLVVLFYIYIRRSGLMFPLQKLIFLFKR